MLKPANPKKIDVLLAGTIPENLHPKLQAFLDYWYSLRDACEDSNIPTRSQINLRDIKSLLPGMIILEHHPQPDAEIDRYRYRLLGSDHYAANQRELTGLWLDEVYEVSELGIVHEVYLKILTGGEPHYWVRNNGVENREFTEFERILTPFREHQDGPANLLIGMWVFREQDTPD